MNIQWKKSLLASACLVASMAAVAQDSAINWDDVLQHAKGETVYFNAWGGNEATNQYLDWAAEQVQDQYGVTLEVVPISEIKDTIRRIETEVAAGKTDNGSVDLVWINGENFAALKKQGLLLEGWAQQLPNWQYVDLSKPVESDFSLPTDGAESPWGGAQLTFIGNRDMLAEPLSSPQALLDYAKGHQGMLTYPRPPDFTGTTFLKQLMLSLAEDPSAFDQAPQDTDAEALTAPLWAYLDQLHPSLWREGKTFPTSPSEMDRMLGDGELAMSITFNPLHAQNQVQTGKLPESVYTFGFADGMIGNVHFVSIPRNAAHPDGAMVVANFLLSPQAQAHKADVSVWGDPTILDANKIEGEEQAALKAVSPSEESQVPVINEPNAAWMDWLREAWTQRYGAQ